MIGRAVAILAATWIAATAGAADPVELRSLFPSEADVQVEGPGLVRLELPPEVLRACRPDLSNVRLFDLEGNEVPFLVDAPRPGTVRELETLAAPPLELAREEIRRQGRPNLRRETYEIQAPGRAPRSGSWALVLESAADTFVARVEVRPSRTGGSVFRITSPRRAEKLRVPVDASAAGRLQVVIEHEQGFWLTPSFRFESTTAIELGTRATIPLRIRSRATAPGRTIVELSRPRGVVPEALRLETTTATFDRRITVEDQGQGRDPAPLAARDLFRFSPGTGVEELELPLRPARGDRLRIVLEDGDSPPLAALSFAAVYARPALVASLSAPAVLRFGGSRARVPRYDLAGLHPQPGREVYGRRAEALVRLYEAGAIGSAHLGPIRSNPAFDPSPALDFAMRPGAAIEPSAWAMRRALVVQKAAEGLTRVRLAPEDLAQLLPDLADLRIADDAGHQWPYLVDPGASTADVPFTVATTRSRDGATTYELATVTAPVIVEGLRLDAESPFFDRAFRLHAETDGKKTVLLAEGRLARPAGDPAPVLLDLPRTRVRALTLEVTDGDDAPLVLRSVVARAPAPDVLVVAPPGTYWLLMGSPDAHPPRYELERVRDVVLVLEPEVRVLGPLQGNPEFRAASRLLRGKGRQQALLWVTIVAAVLVLAALTLRLARREKA